MYSFVTENITPERAEAYLGTSRGNRPLSKIFVHSFADTMKKGRWMLNGVPIIFDEDGCLIDGHHRLEAVREAKIPVRFDVVRGVPSDAFTTYDVGRHRNIGQILAMQGVKNYNIVGSIIAANEALVTNGRLYGNNTVPYDEQKRTLADFYELYRRDEAGYQEVGSYIACLRSRCRIIPTSWAGGMYYYLTHTGGYTENVVKPFFEALFTLESDAIPCVSTLRKVITKEAVEGRKLQHDVLWAYIVKSWNAYITNTPLKSLRFRFKDETANGGLPPEEMPTLILK